MSTVLRSGSAAFSAALHTLDISADSDEAAAAQLTTLANEGNAAAQALLGRMYIDGQGVARDTTQALNWFRLAAAQGHVMAINGVGACLEHGWGTPPDFPAAATNYRLAAEAGLDEGQYHYASLLRTGKGLARDLEQAFTFYNAAAAQGHAAAMNMVGRFYHEGWAVEVNELTAIEWYRRSAEGGDFRGQISYAAVLAEQGDIDASALWLREAMKTALPSVLGGLADSLADSPHEVFQRISLEMKARIPAAFK
ncbi:MAG: tetratricopeptide repeat protein [bacterium]|nr:tetratricopeptide repeat protein [bacterium]